MLYSTTKYNTLLFTSCCCSGLPIPAEVERHLVYFGCRYDAPSAQSLGSGDVSSAARNASLVLLRRRALRPFSAPPIRPWDHLSYSSSSLEARPWMAANRADCICKLRWNRRILVRDEGTVERFEYSFADCTLSRRFRGRRLLCRVERVVEPFVVICRHEYYAFFGRRDAVEDV